jgi:hypothetical protein
MILNWTIQFFSYKFILYKRYLHNVTIQKSWSPFFFFRTPTLISLHVNLTNLFTMLETMKVTCLEATSNLCVEFSCRFPNVEIVIAPSMMYHIIDCVKK